MLFSIIFQVDIPLEDSIKYYKPPRNQLKLWEQTEGDDQFEGSGLIEDEKGKHRKWCAILTRKQFDAFVDHCKLFAENVETMGSIGAPGFGYGAAPAISFDGSLEGENWARVNAYVTPIPMCHKLEDLQKERKLKRPLGKKAWNRIRQVILRKYR